MLPFQPLHDILRRYEDMGYAMRNEEGRWCLTARGYLISNDIITDLLIAQDKSVPLKRI